MIASLRKLLATINRPGRYILGLALISLVSATLNIFFGFGLMAFINSARFTDSSMLYSSLIFVFATAFGLAVLMPLGYWLTDTAAVHGTANLRRRVFKSALRLTASWLEKRHSGDLTSRATNDILAAEKAYSLDLVNLAEVLFGGLGCLTAMLVVDWKLAIAMVVLGVMRAGGNALLSKPLGRAADRVQKALAEVTEQVTDAANGGQVIRMFNSQQALQQKFERHNQAAVAKGLTRIRYAALFNGLNTFTGWLSFIGLITAGGWLIMRGWYDLGTIMLFVQLQNGVNGLFAALGHFITQLQSSLAGSRRVLEIIEQPPEPERVILPAVPRTRAAVALEEVSFAYAPEEGNVLKGVSLRVEEGETVALVGPSGGGKSTVFKLLLGFYSPNAGAISILGKGLDQYTLQELRDIIAYVPQNPYLFNGTIAENIGFGKPGASLEEIEAAARAACAHDFISQFPDGYETMVGERGSHLSGGQRQRIAIARAILRDAPILLLDEATSSLDSESEEQVQLALARLMKNRTTLVIAHRLSTVRDAHRIVVIAGGRVAEEGTHQELLQAGGIYRRLHEMQFAEDMQDAG